MYYYRYYQLPYAYLVSLHTLEQAVEAHQPAEIDLELWHWIVATGPLIQERIVQATEAAMAAGCHWQLEYRREPRAPRQWRHWQRLFVEAGHSLAPRGKNRRLLRRLRSAGFGACKGGIAGTRQLLHMVVRPANR